MADKKKEVKAKKTIKKIVDKLKKSAGKKTGSKITASGKKTLSEKKEIKKTINQKLEKNAKKTVAPALGKNQIKKAIDSSFDSIETREEKESKKNELTKNENQIKMQKTGGKNDLKKIAEIETRKINSSKIIDLSEIHNLFEKPIKVPVEYEKTLSESLSLNEEVIGFYAKYIAIGVVLSAVVYTLLSMQGRAFMSLSILPLVGIIGISTYLRKRKIAGYEEMFSNMLNDLRDLLQGGMTITQSLEIIAKNDYSTFSHYADKLAAQVKIGIPFEIAMKNVFNTIDSPMIKKSVYVIVESHSQGGNLMKVFAATSKYIIEIERLKLQRKTVTYSALFTSYLMFFIFLGIIVAIQAFFLPLLSNTTVFQQAVQQPIDFKTYFLYLLIIQCIFAGPMIGKISENSLISGIRHSLILLAVALPIYLASIVLA